jgi:hypothetical protein
VSVKAGALISLMWELPVGDDGAIWVVQPSEVVGQEGGCDPVRRSGKPPYS